MHHGSLVPPAEPARWGLSSRRPYRVNRIESLLTRVEGRLDGDYYVGAERVRRTGGGEWRPSVACADTNSAAVVPRGVHRPPSARRSGPEPVVDRSPYGQ